MFKTLRFLVVVLLLSAVPAQSASLEQVFAQAQEAYKAGRYTDAAVLFTQAADAMLKSKETAKAQMLLGNAAVALIKGEDHNGAIQIYERILKLPGSTPQDILLKTYKNLVISHGTVGNQALKILALEKMMKVLPKLPQAELANVYAQLGDAYRAVEIYTKAESSYGKALYLLPKDANPAVKARILTAMGLCQGNLGDFAKAEASLIQARTLAAAIKEPLTLAESDSNLGILHWERGDYPQALQLLNTAITTEKSSALRRNEGVESNNLGLVEKSIGRYAESMKFFEEALRIAREVGNKKDEAIALSNRALLYRMTGKLNEARADYRAALALYEEVGFQEGKAGALLGTGKIAELEDRNLEVALNNYQEALDIYTRISLPRSQAEALLQIGGVFKSTSAPGRATRDLVFDDEPVAPKIDKSQAVIESAAAYGKALQLAEAVSSKEMIWAARQGVGFSLLQQDKLEQAFDQYKQAIDMVTRMRTNLKSVALLGEYMAGKEDLYGEALEVCARLYAKTKDKKYLELQMQWDETLRNEIQKASTALVQMNFTDPSKQQVYEKIKALGNRMDKAESAIPVVAVLPANATAELKATAALKAESAKSQKIVVQKLEGDYQKLLAEWKQKYPRDAVMFESAARVNIATVQKALKPDQVMLQYIPLEKQLIIVAVSATKVDNYIVDVPVKTIDTAIKKDFLGQYLEKYGRIESPTAEEESTYLTSAVKTLKILHDWLIFPAAASLENKKRIYVVTNGFISQVPFAALVSSNEAGNVDFLVEKYDISSIRPSFIETLTKMNDKASTKQLLAVGNPKNKKVTMLSLDGAKKEIERVDTLLLLNDDKKDIKYERYATDAWFTAQLAKTNYETIYFATHGMPYSEVYLQYNLLAKRTIPGLASLYKMSEDDIRKEFEFIQAELPSMSPLNGYLYMADDEKNATNGLLTIKKISEIPDTSFKSTQLVLLSACNTGVTFAPKTLKNTKVEDAFSNNKEMEKELRKAGWIPGVDQVSFVDIFMRRGINAVYGTLWFANDDSSSYIVSSFMGNLHKQGDKQDAVEAYSTTLRTYIADAKQGKKLLGPNYNEPLHPFLWAAGAIFGK